MYLHSHRAKQNKPEENEDEVSFGKNENNSESQDTVRFHPERLPLKNTFISNPWLNNIQRMFVHKTSKESARRRFVEKRKTFMDTPTMKSI